MATREHLLPWVSIVVGPVLLLGPALVRGEVLFWGTPLLQFVPWREFALDVLRQGHLPLWNPLLGMGAPLVANYQSALFYPPNWLLGLLGVAEGQGWLVLLHWVWAGAGMVVLTRRLGICPFGQSVAGLAWGLSSALVARAGFLSINAAAAWIPWIVAACDRGAGEGRDRLALPSVVLLALCLGLQWLAGHAQTSWYTLVLAFFWSGWRGARLRGWVGAGRALGALALAAGMALALAAVQLVPTVEYLIHSARSSGLEEAYALSYSMWPWRILGLLLPGLFGSPVQHDYWGYANFWEDALYIGVIPFLLSVVAIVRGMRGLDRWKGEARLLTAVALGSLLLALGKNTPIFVFLFRHVPGFDLFQAPTRWNLLFVFSLGLLAGLGAESWTALAGRALYWSRLGTAGAAALGLSAWLLGPRLIQVEPSFIRAFSVAGVWLFMAGVLALARRPQPGVLWMSAVSACVVADLVWANWGLNPTTSRDLYQEQSTLARLLPNDHRLHLPGAISRRLTFDRLFRFDTFDPGVDWRLARDWGLPDSTMLDGLRSADNFDPLLPARYVDWMDRLEAAPEAIRDRLLVLMDVGWVGRLEGERVVYVEREGAARVRLYSRAMAVEDGEHALQMVLAPDFDPERTLVVENGGEEIEHLVGAAAAVLELEDLSPNHVRVQVQAPGGAWLLLADSWYPGWQAKVDGETTPIYRADYLFRAVWVPPGEHEVRFEYVPRSFWLGALCSALGGVAVLATVRRWRLG